MSAIKKIVVVVLCLILSLQSSLIISADTVSDCNSEFNLRKVINKAKIDESIYENIDSEGKSTVYIWLEDIEQNEVEEKVEKDIGFDIDEIDSNDDIDLNNLKQSDNKRRIEKEKTDKYIVSKRKHAKESFTEKKKNIIELEDIKESIIYESQYTPLILAELTIDEIEALAESDEVAEIGYYSSEEEETDLPEFNTGLYDEYVFSDTISDSEIDDFENFVEATGIVDIKTQSGLTGDGVVIGALDGVSFLNHDVYLPKTRCYSNQNYTQNMNAVVFEHATSTALMMAGTNGIASKATFYMIESYGNYYYSAVESYIMHMEELVRLGASVINLSTGYVGQERTLAGKFTDYLISNYNVVVVKSAGNNYQSDFDFDGLVTHPGNSDNVITVGACNNMMTEDKSDDKMYDYSSFVDESVYDFTVEADGTETVIYEDACMKPDLVAPANVLVGGTSMAAPFVTGVVALMLECRPTLALHPEVVKAILLASCHYKADPAFTTDSVEEMEQGLTEKQGAGVIDPYLALSITANGNYGYGIIQEGNSKNIKFNQSPYDATGINVSVAWLRNTNKVNDVYEYTMRNNLDLFVYRNGVLVFNDENNPNKTSSSAEMVYSSINTLARNYDSEIEYDVRIDYINDDLDNSTESVRYGYAWSTNSDVYSDLEEHEGLYFIKNVSTQKYLTCDIDSNTMEMMNYLGHYYDNYDQLFIITANQNGSYKIGSLWSEYNTGIGMDGANVTNSYVPAEISISKTNNGYYVFKTDSDTEWLTSSGGLAWETRSELSSQEYWILEKVNYRIGDNDMSGNIDATDYNYAYKYCCGITTPTNSDWILSDTNCDGFLNSDDLDFYTDIIME